ncbi:MAG: cryptochrome/photolyase family protein [Marinovum sp.]|nr:cryptochrome/photolyase family protein [Marinovum sp.]
MGVLVSTVLLILPNQLFDPHPGFKHGADRIVLFEDPLFFQDAQYEARFHRQKLWLHRSSMARYLNVLRSRNVAAEVVSFDHRRDATARMIARLKADGVSKIVMAHPVDHTAERRLEAACTVDGIGLIYLDTPGFLNSHADNLDWAAGRKRWFMAEFYKSQRRRLDVLMDGNEPVGGQWSFDEDNRKKIPKALINQLPIIDWPRHDIIDEAARQSVEADFPDALGSIDRLYYPTSHGAAAAWLDQFLERRFALFGDYEDAILEDENWLWHAVLTPALNIGLLTPRQILDATLAHAAKQDVAMNSLEGFLRQIIGWREFMRATYEDLGVKMRTTNHWQHTRKMPTCFYDGTTGIGPIDDTIKRILDTGYCHHIERLMILGGFMFLCEIDPDEVYRWFMEMFVDSYDWVMVPNAYAMSQHADGGLITTKPYFSGSNYVRKMSHWPKGPWAETWDGLYWRFILKHSEALASNPRWSMMCRTAQRMKPETRDAHLHNAEAFLGALA